MALVAALGLATPVRALEVTVDSSLDAPDANVTDGVCADAAGNCTLRAAVEQLDFDDDPTDQDRINLPAGDYELTNAAGPLRWTSGPSTDAGEIIGDGAASTAIEQTLAARVVEASNPLALEALTITGGDSATNGGGILADTPLTLDAVAVTGSQADQFGGGLSSTGATTIRDSVIGPGNTAGLSGGGISVTNAPLTVERSVVHNNTSPGGFGAGIEFNDPTTGNDLTIEESTVRDNTGAVGGGGVSFRSDDPAGDLLLRRSTVSGNQSDQEGGGIEVTEGDLVAQNSTISGNTVSPGGVSQGGGVKLRPATGSEETEANLINVTLAGNSADAGSAVHSGGLSMVQLFGSIVSGSCMTAGSGSFSSNGYNVETGNTCNLGGTGDQPDTDPVLGSLASNGGLTMTHAIGPGSPALDVTPPTVAPCGAELFSGHIDQRGAPRPSGSACDAGAFEFQVSAPEPPPPQPPGGGSGGVSVAQAPPNTFQLGRLVRNKKKGIAFLFVNVPGPGEVGLAGKGVKNVGISSATAQKSVFTPGGVVKLKIKPGKGKQARKVARQLRDKGRAKLKLRVTYVPTGGTATTQARKVKLVRR